MALMHGNKMSKLDLVDIATKSVRLEIHRSELWSIINRDAVSKLYFECETVQQVETEFMKLVEIVVKKRMQQYVSPPQQIEGMGFFLVYDILGSFFDGFSSDQTDGFFDNADAPPPEFWLGIFERKLVSYVPNRFAHLLELAHQGLADMCLVKYDSIGSLKNTKTNT
jgi:hypothetical protein